MIKIEIPAGDSQALKRFGQALIGLAADITGQPTTGDDVVLSSEGEWVDTNDKTVAGQLDTVSVRGKDTPLADLDSDLTEDAARKLTSEKFAKNVEHLATDTRQDPNGVPFNPEYCGSAAIPFYASGPREGQWKKRKGVADEAYDAWYASARPIDEAPANEQLDTSDAFGTGDQTSLAEPIPTDCGTFMGWVSAQQAAGRLTQTQVNDGYTQCGVKITDLFPPNPADQIAQNIAKLHALLSQLAELSA